MSDPTDYPESEIELPSCRLSNVWHSWYCVCGWYATRIHRRIMEHNDGHYLATMSLDRHLVTAEPFAINIIIVPNVACKLHQPSAVKSKHRNNTRKPSCTNASCDFLSYLWHRAGKTNMVRNLMSFLVVWPLAPVPCPASDCFVWASWYDPL